MKTDKLKNLFKNRKQENLVVFLIILVITLVIINNIIKEDDKKQEKKYSNAELAATSSDTVEASSDNLETRLENILSKIDGVGEVSVLVTYSQTSQIIPLYNENVRKSTTEEKDTSGGVRTIESEDNEKSVVTGSDSNPVTRKKFKSYYRRSHCDSKRC